MFRRSCLFGALALVLTSSLALADAERRPVVVDIHGDLDAGALREDLARELQVDVIAPDDERAGTAKERIVVEAKPDEKKLTVRYEKVGAVARTVDLPDDRWKATRVARYLAGNLARHEAEELIGKTQTLPASGERAAGEEERAAAAPEAAAGEEAMRKAALRAVLTDYAAREKSGRIWTAITSFGLATAVIPTSVVLLSSSREDARNFGLALSIHAGLYTTMGALDLAIGSGIHEDLLEHLQDGEAAKKPSNVTFSETESRWRDAADRAATWRHIAAGILMCGGVFVTTLGLALPAMVKSGERDDSLYAIPYALTAIGSASMVGGVALLFSESPVETSYHVYRLSAPGSPPKTSRVGRPTFGGAVLPEGGAVGSVRFSF